MSNRWLAAISVVAFCAGIIVLALFDGRLSTFLGILIAAVGGATPLAVISRRKETDS